MKIQVFIIAFKFILHIIFYSVVHLCISEEQPNFQVFN